MIHFVGDSHVSMFTGLHGVCPRFWEFSPQALPDVRVWHIGAFLAYSLAKPGHRSRTLVRRALAGVARDERVFFSFGEIDCRFHVVKHARSATAIKLSAAKIARDYVEAAVALAGKRPVGFLTVSPATITQHGNTIQPTNGTFAQRKMAARAFNDSLKRAAARCGADVVDTYELLRNARHEPESSWFADGVHADPRALPRVLGSMVRHGRMELDSPALVAASALAMVSPSVGSARLPGGLEDARVAREALVEMAALRCKAIGVRSIAIAGAGKHTRAMGFAAFERFGLRVEAVLDDVCGDAEVLGAKVMKFQECPKRVGAVVISSDAHEERLILRAREVLPKRVAIIPIYSWRADTPGA